MVSDGVPAVACQHVIVASHHNHVQRSGLGSVEVVELESMTQGLYICPSDGNIVHVHGVPCIEGG